MTVDRIGRVVVLGATLAALLGPVGARAEDATELAKKVQNPIGSLISLPFESNFNFENGTDDDDRRDVSTFYVQPFVNYNLPRGWYLTSSPLVSANWKAKSGEEWRVPVGGGAGKVFCIGSQNINTRLVAYYNVERPTRSADWSIQWTLRFLFPR